MIRKRAKEAFVNRVRRDFRTMKKLPAEKLEAMMHALPVKPPIWRRLKLHQKLCFIIGAQERRFAFFNDTGTGKTLLCIALARYFRKAGIVRQVLVLVPRRINKREWVLEIEKHSPETSVLVLRGSTKNKWEQLRSSKALLVVDSYPGFVRMVCSLVPNKKKKKNRLKPDKALVREIKQRFQGLIMDESTYVSNHMALPFRICRQLCKPKEQMVFALTGTPFGRDPGLLWPQMFLIDHGYTLGETLGLFRSVYYKSTEDYWGHVEHQFIRKQKPLLHRMLANQSIRIQANAADLPSVVAIEKIVYLPTDAQTYYDKAKEAILAAKGNFTEMKNAFLRMRQISSGFIGYRNDETGDKASFVFPENPKMDMLLSIVEGIDPATKVIVFHDFNWSGHRICEELRKLEITYTHLYGGTKNADAEYDRFRNDPNKQVLVLQNQLGIGLNLQVAQYGLYFESPVSVIMRQQTRARFVRQESAHQRVFLYDLITHGTVDRKILEFHKSGRDLFRAIVDGDVRL